MDRRDYLNYELYIIGDFNILYKSDINYFKNKQWKDVILKFRLKQLVHIPIRVSKHSSTIINHINTNRHIYSNGSKCTFL